MIYFSLPYVVCFYSVKEFKHSVIYMPKHPYIYQEHGNTYLSDTCEDLTAAVQAGKVRLEALARSHYPGQRLEHNNLPGNNISRLTVYINELFLHLLEMLRENNIDLNPSLSSTHRTVELFFADLKSNRETLSEPWTVETMAQQCDLGVTSFVHYCKHLLNTTPAQYINQQRIEAATRQLIDDPHSSITEIAYSSGFCSSQYFATVFRRHTGFSPKKFRERHISKQNI